MDPTEGGVIYHFKPMDRKTDPSKLGQLVICATSEQSLTNPTLFCKKKAEKDQSRIGSDSEGLFD
jgi:hypothetical protein